MSEVRRKSIAVIRWVIVVVSMLMAVSTMLNGRDLHVSVAYLGWGTATIALLRMDSVTAEETKP